MKKVYDTAAMFWLNLLEAQLGMPFSKIVVDEPPAIFQTDTPCPCCRKHKLTYRGFLTSKGIEVQCDRVKDFYNTDPDFLTCHSCGRVFLGLSIHEIGEFSKVNGESALDLLMEVPCK